MLNKVCVLLAVYNGERFLREQLDSLLFQSGVLVDIYIRVDPSTDNSMKIVESYVNRYPNVYVVGDNLPSGSAGQNFLTLLKIVDFSNYDFVSFSDQDDIWYVGKLKRAVERINATNSDGYSSNVLAWWENGSSKVITKSHPQKEYDFMFESAGPGCTFVMKKKLALDIQHFLVGLGEKTQSIWLHDWFCYAYARSKGFVWLIDSEVTMKYRQHESNSVGANSGLSAIFNRVREVVSGQAFYRVIEQASILGLEDELPIKRLRSNNFGSMSKLVFSANKYRRRSSEVFLFACAILVRAFGKRNV